MNRTLRGTAALAVLGLAAAGATMGTMGAAESAPPSPRVAFTATLAGPDGHALANTTVRLSALVDDKTAGVTSSVPLDETTTDANGVFSLSGDNPGRFRAAAARGIELEVETVGDGPAAGFFYDMPALPPGPGQANWQLDLPGAASARAADAVLHFKVGEGLVAADAVSTAVVTDDGDPVYASSGAGTSSPMIYAPSGEDNAAYETTTNGTGQVEVPAGYTVVAAPLGSTSTSCRAGDPSGWARTGDIKSNYVPTKYLRSRDKATFNWKWTRTHETSLGVVAIVKGTKSKGGLSASLSEKSSLDVSPTSTHGQRAMFSMKWIYAKQQKYCVMQGAGVNGIYWLDVFRWAPDYATGGNLILPSSGTFTCGTGAAYHDFFAAPVAVSKSTTVTYGGFYEIAGITLDLKQSDADAETFTITPDSSAQPAKACGWDAAPAYATLTKEVKY